MIKKVFKGIVNGKEFTNETSYNKAVLDALTNDKDISAHASYEEVNVPDEKPKVEQKHIVDNGKTPSVQDKEVARFVNNLKKVNDFLEGVFTEDPLLKLIKGL